jgi:hypothetical protein
MTHVGKIGRLPEELQEELNLRLLARWPLPQLLDWLQSQPGVQPLLDLDFGGKKITPRNLAAWKSSGFQQWLVEETAFMEAFQRTINQQLARAAQEAKLTHDQPTNP